MKKEMDTKKYLSMSFLFIYIPFQISGDATLIKSLSSFWKGMLESISIESSIHHKQEAWRVHIEHIDTPNEQTILCLSQKLIQYRVPLKDNLFMRTVSMMREIFVKVSLSKGFCWLHASAFKLNEKTYLVIGNKGRGKTTWLMSALYHKKAKFIGNDQVPIIQVNNTLYVYRWRPDIKISPDTLRYTGINSEIQSNEKNDRFILMPFAEQYCYIDFHSWSESRNQNIQPFPMEFLYEISELENVVSGIIYLDKSASNILEIAHEDYKDEIWKSYLYDPEVIFPEQLANWFEEKKYWLRLNGLTASQKIVHDSERCRNHLVTKVPLYRVNYRLSIDEISSCLEKMW